MHPAPYDPTRPLPPERPLNRYRSTDDHIADREHHAAWLAHLEAGRIGGNPPAPIGVAARRARNEEVLRRFFRQ